MNLTITIDDELLRRARIRALSQGTSVNAVLREFLESYAGCRCVLSEDLQSDQDFAGVAVENPFVT